jgi:hypothetical protein
MALPATKVSAPASATRRMLSTLMPPSTSSRMSLPEASMRARARLDLAQGRFDEALAAEARVDAHDQDQVDVFDDPVQHVQRLAGIEHHTRLAAGGTDRLDAAVHMAAGVRMETDQVGTGLRKSRRQRIDRLHHQVHVDRHRHAGGRAACGWSAEQTIGPKVRLGT